MWSRTRTQSTITLRSNMETNNVKQTCDGCDASGDAGWCRQRAADHHGRGDAGTRSGPEYAAGEFDDRHQLLQAKRVRSFERQDRRNCRCAGGQGRKVEAFIVSVGGFLGIGEKDVAVPFSAVHGSEKNGSWYLTMDATKDSLKAAHGYKYDRAKAT